MFAAWTDSADFGGERDFYGLQALAVRQWIEAGESFAHMILALDDDRTP